MRDVMEAYLTAKDFSLDNRVFCKVRSCEISVSGCLARQRRAQSGTNWRNNRAEIWKVKAQVPYDPLCKNCEQGKEVQVFMEKAMEENKESGLELIKPTAEPVRADQQENVDTKNVTQKEEGPADKKDPNYGYCKCGCGQKTRIAKCNDTANGYLAGEPVNYIRGHAIRNRKRNTVPKNKNTKFGISNGKNSLIDMLLLCIDGKELECELIRRSVVNLRSIEGQAVWELAEALRRKG